MNLPSRPRPGFSLAELTAATAMMAALTTASFVLVRTANDAWHRHRDDAQQRGDALAALQHIVRRVRQAAQVVEISAADDPSGRLSLQRADGTTETWDHDAGARRISYGTLAPADPLVDGVDQATFIGLAADGQTPSVDPASIHAVRCVLRYPLNRPAGATDETISCVAWLRAW